MLMDYLDDFGNAKKPPPNHHGICHVCVLPRVSSSHWQLHEKEQVKIGVALYSSRFSKSFDQWVVRQGNIPPFFLLRIGRRATARGIVCACVSREQKALLPLGLQLWFHSSLSFLFSFATFPWNARTNELVWDCDQLPYFFAFISVPLF